MADPQTIIADAFHKLQRSVSNDDAHNFASTELKDIWTAVREIESTQRKRQSAQNLRRIEPFLRGIEKYSKVVEVLCNGTPYMPYSWAPIKLMLEIASHHRDVFEALLSAYADIGAALPRFDRYMKVFDDNLEFQHALAAIYASILDFHQRAYKFFRRRAWHVIFLSLWKDFGSRFDGIIESLKKQRDFIDTEAASFGIVEAKESRIRMQEEIRHRQKQDLELIEEKEKKTKIAQLQHSVSWLCSDERIQETEYERISNRRHDKTCEWIGNEPLFRGWVLDDAKRPCLWLNGKPGSGKTVMCSYIVQNLANIQGLTACYYFCNSQDTGNTCHHILTILVLQILRQYPDICSLIANEYVYRGLNCSMAQLRLLIPAILAMVPYIRIVIDGVDECSMENQQMILKELQRVCTGPLIRSKILFSSRREVHIREQLSNHQIPLDERQEVHDDIRSFIRDKIMKLPATDQDLLGRVETVLVKKAHGMFLWVQLVMDELKHCYSDAALEETATSLPKGLKAAYGRILDRIMDHSNPANARNMAIRILGWMACSYRSLKTYELLDGVALNLSKTVLTSKSKVRKEVLNLCRPLIEDGPGGTLEFVHFSAKEYILEEDYHLQRPFIWRETAHLDISFSCVTFLNSCLPLLPTNSTAQERAAILVQGFHGLLVYADTFWLKHLTAYCDTLAENGRSFSLELLAQLQLLASFQKNKDVSVSPSIVQLNEDIIKDNSLAILDPYSEIRQLVFDVLIFRAKLNKESSSEKSRESITLEWCELDPTHFSTVRHYYQQTIESLLDKHALANFPSLKDNELQAFRDTYGSYAFVCRYQHCENSSDGFPSSSLRDRHELKHQQRFRCGHPSCFSFGAGFASRALLNRHNDRHHLLISEGPSLVESLVSSALQLKASAAEFIHDGPTPTQGTPGTPPDVNQHSRAKSFYPPPPPPPPLPHGQSLLRRQQIITQQRRSQITAGLTDQENLMADAVTSRTLHSMAMDEEIYMRESMRRRYTAQDIDQVTGDILYAYIRTQAGARVLQEKTQNLGQSLVVPPADTIILEQKLAQQIQSHMQAPMQAQVRAHMEAQAGGLYSEPPSPNNALNAPKETTPITSYDQIPVPENRQDSAQQHMIEVLRRRSKSRRDYQYPPGTLTPARMPRVISRSQRGFNQFNAGITPVPSYSGYLASAPRDLAQLASQNSSPTAANRAKIDTGKRNISSTSAEFQNSPSLSPV